MIRRTSRYHSAALRCYDVDAATATASEAGTASSAAAAMRHARGNECNMLLRRRTACQSTGMPTKLPRQSPSVTKPLPQETSLRHNPKGWPRIREAVVLKVLSADLPLCRPPACKRRQRDLLLVINNACNITSSSALSAT